MAETRDSATNSQQLNSLGLPRSNRPLFAPRNREWNHFADAVKVASGGEEESKVSRIPRARTYSPEALARSGSGNGREHARPSPPRAAITPSLKSAYEKVVREEEMTVGSGATTVTDPRDMSPSPASRVRLGSREADERRMGRLRAGRAVALGKERRTSLPQEHTPPVLGQEGDEDLTSSTNMSGSTGSISGSVRTLSESSTDGDIGKKLNNYARDQERAKSALSSGKGLFAKGGVGTLVTDTATTLSPRSSGGNLENDPGVRPAAQWGSRAKKSNKWLQRIMSPESSGEIELPPAPAPEPVPAPPPVIENSIDWASAAADVPLPSVEGSLSTAQEPTPPHSRPSSSRPSNESPEKSQLWDADLDFTARSLQVSTSPLLKIRSSKLDDIVAREQEMLSKRAVASSRLEEIRERNSEERSVSPEVVRKPSFPRSLSGIKTQEPIAEMRAEREIVNDAPITSSVEISRGRGSSSEPVKATLDKTRPRKPSPLSQEEVLVQEKSILEEEGEAIPGTPITVFRNGARDGTSKVELSHKRSDSFDALRKLAKIASPSPSPNPAIDKSEDIAVEERSMDRLAIEQQIVYISPPKSDVDPEERIAAEASLFELPDSKSEKNSEKNSIREPSPVSDPDLSETPRRKHDPLSFPTPVVTGAYVDTPAATIRQSKIVRSLPPSTEVGDSLQNEVSRLALKDFIRGPSAYSSKVKNVDSATEDVKDQIVTVPSSEPKVQEQIKEIPKPRPPIKNTAKPASVKDDLRRIQQETQIDDSTLDDFDELLGAEEVDFDLNSTTIMEPQVNLERDNRGEPLSEKERERRLEMLAYDRMNKSLKSGLLNIRDAKRGIERLEDRVSSSPEPFATSGPHSPDACTDCTAPTSTYHLTLPIPRLWTHDATRWAGVRLTWLGLAIALLITWYISESVTCDFICHPVYATTNNWSYTDPFWGGALPTLADRLSGGSLSLLGNFLVSAAVDVWAGWTGAETSIARGLAGSAARAQGARYTPPVWSEGSMFEDERI